jgi:hypothetical protein
MPASPSRSRGSVFLCGYANAAEWRRAHEDFFRSAGITEFLGLTPVIDDGTLVVTERFRLIKADDSTGL